MANEFIARKGLIALEDSQISGSLSVTNSVTASFFTGSFIGDGSQLSGVSAGFPFTGSAQITGSLGVTGSVTATSFIGDGSQLTGIADPTPITATINNTNSPFTVTSQSIVVIDSTNGDVTVNLPDLDAINGTPEQKPILLYKNDYSQNVIYVQPSGSQLVNGTTQDLIVSIQIGIVYNPTSAGWVTEGTSYQSLAELEMFFVPRTETGSFATTGSNQFSGSQTITGSLTVTGDITGNITGSASTASYVEYTNVANKPAIVSGSSQITYSGLTGIPSGILSGSAQIAAFGYATTGSNQFSGSQTITGSLTVTGQVVAQTLNVQQVTSSIVYSSGSNVFGNSVSNTQQFTGSVSVTGSLTVAGAGTFTTSITPLILKSTNATTMWTEYYYNTSTLSGYIGSGGGILSGANTSDFIIRSEADFVVATGGNNRRLTIATTGAATFSNSIYGTSALFGSDFLSNETSKVGISFGSGYGQINAWGANTSTYGGLKFQLSVSNGGTINALTLTTAGATFSSSVTAIGTLTGGGTNYLVNTSTGTNPVYQRILTTGGDVIFGIASSTGTSLLPGVGNYATVLYNNTNTDISFGTNQLLRMTITSGGNVGIGTTDTQTFRLAVDGPNVGQGDATTTIRILDTTSATTGTGGGISFAGYFNGTSSFVNTFSYIKGGKENSTAGNYASYLSFGTRANDGSPTERMRITSGGNVLIGINTSIGALLEVKQPTLAIGSIFQAWAPGVAGANFRVISTTGQPYMQYDFNNGAIQVGGFSTGAAVSLRIMGNSNSQVGHFNHDGQLYMPFLDTSTGTDLVLTSGGFINKKSSSIRYKENITPIDIGLDFIMSLNPVKFNMKSDGLAQVGFVAEEFPDERLVSFSQIDIEDASKGLQRESINYAQITAPLVKALQEQQSQIEILKAEIQTLKQ